MVGMTIFGIWTAVVRVMGCGRCANTEEPYQMLGKKDDSSTSSANLNTIVSRPCQQPGENLNAISTIGMLNSQWLTSVCVFNSFTILRPGITGKSN